MISSFQETKIEKDEKEEVVVRWFQGDMPYGQVSLPSIGDLGGMLVIWDEEKPKLVLKFEGAFTLPLIVWDI